MTSTKKFKAYISCPVSIPRCDLKSFVSHIAAEYNCEVKAWDRDGRYSDHDLVTCNAFLIVLPEVSWKYSMDSLPSGCKKELQKAMDLDIPVYLVYKVSTGDIKVYQNRIYNNSIIEGISCSSYKFREAVDKFREADDNFNTTLIPYDQGLGKTTSLSSLTATPFTPSSNITPFISPGEGPSFDKRVLLLI